MTILNTKIYKKVNSTGTFDTDYVLYHPETDSEQVIYSYTGLANINTVKDALNSIFNEIDAISGVLEFKGNATVNGVNGLPTDDNRKGEVYVVQYPATGSDHHIYWSATGTQGTWEEYPSNTLFVCSADTTKNYIKDETNAAAKAGWIPLGGTNSAYATKNEAVGSITLSNSGLQYTNVAGDTTVTVSGVIGTTLVNTVGIASTSAGIVSGSSQLVTAGAVYDFASTAGKINATETNGNATYYITFVDGSGDGKTVYVDSVTNPLSYNPSTNTINANISGNAATATTANNANIATLAESLRSSLSIFGQSYDGSTAKTIKAGQGLSVSTPAGSTTTTISVGAGNGITVNASSIAVAAKTGGAISVTDQGVDIAEINTITADAVYSAVQVDKYGRAKAGGQSIIFAKGLNDPDLGDLVIGGLAFIGTSTAAASTYTGNAASSANIGIMDDAE